MMMKRRKFGVLGASGLMALASDLGMPKSARAGVPADQAAQLQSTLTPFGAERAGNADGSIPAWNGGLTQTLPGWTTSQQQPDYFAEDALVLTIDKLNVAKYSDMLSVGVAKMITQYDGFSVHVYPTHRTAAATQWVYDNAYQNALHSSLDSRGGRFGFLGAYGGPAFPILDADPDVAGPQVIWNHLTRWAGFNRAAVYGTYTVSHGIRSIGGAYLVRDYYPYYDPAGSLATFDGWEDLERVDYVGPPINVGEVVDDWISTNGYDRPDQAWELLNGQGRVRKAPELEYDTPLPSSNGIIGVDEAYGFQGDPHKYNWKYLGKKEMYIPYNNNRLIRSDPNQVMGAQFVDPTVVRYEKHRVHVIDATLASGERNVLAHRRLYVNEDNWHVSLTDAWDANGDFLKAGQNTNINTPNLPGTVYGGTIVNNLQSNDYIVDSSVFTTATQTGWSYAPFNKDLFNPQFISAAAQF